MSEAHKRLVPKSQRKMSSRDRGMVILGKTVERMTQTQAVIARNLTILGRAHDNLVSALLEKGVLLAADVRPPAQQSGEPDTQTPG